MKTHSEKELLLKIWLKDSNRDVQRILQRFVIVGNSLSSIGQFFNIQGDSFFDHFYGMFHRFSISDAPWKRRDGGGVLPFGFFMN